MILEKFTKKISQIEICKIFDEFFRYSLRKKERSWNPISIYYREKNNMDIFYVYYFDNKYLYVKTWNSKYYIKYLIDKIRKIV